MMASFYSIRPIELWRLKVIVGISLDIDSATCSSKVGEGRSYCIKPDSGMDSRAVDSRHSGIAGQASWKRCLTNECCDRTRIGRPTPSGGSAIWPMSVLSDRNFAPHYRRHHAASFSQCNHLQPNSSLLSSAGMMLAKKKPWDKQTDHGYDAHTHHVRFALNEGKKECF
jgi:hypothetical protein